MSNKQVICIKSGNKNVVNQLTNREQQLYNLNYPQTQNAIQI